MAVPDKRVQTETEAVVSLGSSLGLRSDSGRRCAWTVVGAAVGVLTGEVEEEEEEKAMRKSGQSAGREVASLALTTAA